MRPMASIYQLNSMEDTATAAGRLLEDEVLECVKVDCMIARKNVLLQGVLELHLLKWPNAVKLRRLG
jgi:hypothetical protein